LRQNLSKMEELRKLPIGRQYFASVRKDNAIYIDKTEYIYNICSPADSAYFLSRPRRFGKSLTLDTIAELFSGNRALFERLWIADKWDWSETYPVIRMSLDNISHEQGLKQALFKELNRIARTFDVTLEEDTGIGSAFRELIEAIAEKTGKQVVILIDEYDRPVMDYIYAGDSETGNANRETLRHFFAIIKNASNHIRLLFITCVSKFAEVGIFVELNHLINLTEHPKYLSLCGVEESDKKNYK
jgi:Predicted AAA-ATPase